MSKQSEFEKVLSDARNNFGDRAFKASEAPPVKVISTGIASLDVATGVGGIPRGTMVETFGRESIGKTAMLLYAMAEVHKRDGFTALINLESNITKEGWLNWAVSIAPPSFDPERIVIINADPGSESLTAFGKMISSGAFDIVGYDSIGAMSTDKELIPGEAKQAYGQSAAVTQLIKQAAKFAYDKDCVAWMINQVRDDAAGRYVIEKAPGGHAKDHFATLRIYLKPNWAGFDKVDMGEGEKDFAGFRVVAKISKNKVGSPRRRAGWNYWNVPSPDGVVGIDTFQAFVDVALQSGAIRRGGAWYYHDDFPNGKLNGGAAVTDFLRKNPHIVEQVRQEMVMQAWNTQGNVMEETEDETQEVQV
jgi:recombination protein RecA